jgi:hypothetical protein
LGLANSGIEFVLLKWWPIFLMEKHGLIVFENILLSRILGPKRGEVGIG